VIERGSVVVICAMDSEATHLRERLERPQEHPIHVWRRTTGWIGSVPVEIVVSGIGLINAAATTSALCIGQRPRAIMNYGCSGAHRSDIHCGDVVLANRVVHHSAVIIQPDGAERYQGFRYDINGETMMTEAILPDPELFNLASEAAGRTPLPAWPGVDHDPVVHVGAVGSADIWTQHGERIHTLHKLHGSLCEEMEAAAVGQVAAIFGVPFLAVKDISNNELHTVTELGNDWGALHDVKGELGLRAALVVESTIAMLS
jgi:adenosylhomocysteine nucleosidase